MDLKVVISDTQAPLHDRRAVAAVCNLLADRASAISEVHQVGDFFDFTGVSRWVDGTLSEQGLQKELDQSDAMMADFHAAYKGPKTRIMGNHDDRLKKYLASKAKALVGLRALDYDTLTDASRHGWETKAQPYRVAPKVESVHGWLVRGRAGYTAHAHMERVGGSVIHGHTHRAALVYRTQGKRTTFGMEVGNLMDPRLVSYASFPDWQQAIAALYIDGDSVWPQLIELKPDRSLMFEGRRYKP